MNIVKRISMALKQIGITQEIAARSETEIHSLTESVKATIERVKQTEAALLPTLIAIYDNIFALASAARRSANRHVAEQIDFCESECRACVERVDLKIIVATSGTPFDAKLHRVINANQTASSSCIVAQTVACGYVFRGQLIRPAGVILK
jgi:molecular chaperone GrpE (heat shock protein)